MILLTAPDYGVPRDSEWDALSLRFRKANKTCWGCARPTKVAHHVLPFHKYPALELVVANLAAVCDLCHLCICHCGDFQLWDPTCRTRLAEHLARVVRALTLKGP